MSFCCLKVLNKWISKRWRKYFEIYAVHRKQNSYHHTVIIQTHHFAVLRMRYPQNKQNKFRAYLDRVCPSCYNTRSSWVDDMSNYFVAREESVSKYKPYLLQITLLLFFTITPIRVCCETEGLCGKNG